MTLKDLKNEQKYLEAQKEVLEFEILRDLKKYGVRDVKITKSMTYVKFKSESDSTDGWFHALTYNINTGEFVSDYSWKENETEIYEEIKEYMKAMH